VALVVSGLFLAYFPFQPSAVTNSRWKYNNRTNEIDVDGNFDSLSNIADDFNLVSPLAGGREQIKIQIKNGTTGLEVARILDSKGLLAAEDFLKLVYLFELEKSIKAGNYVFRSDAGVSKIFEKIIIRGGD
jgi:hypothetical protein